jgi:photosystem II stability/assembly factor-like uncharacterized protein
MKTLKSIKYIIFILAVSYFYSQHLQSQTLYEFGIQFTNDSTATLVGADGLIMYTSNGGNSWTQQQSNTTNILLSTEITYHVYSLMSPLRIPIGITAGENGIILQTIDVGNTWNIIPSGTLEHLRSVGATQSTDNVTVCGDSGVILLSTDVGASFNNVYSGISNNLYGVSFSPKVPFLNESMIGVIVGDKGTILISADNGASWTKINSNTTKNLRSISWANTDYATIVGENGAIYNSTDRGNTWFPSQSKFKNHFNSVKYVDQNTGVAVGDSGTIIRSTDNGQTWIAEQSNTQLSIMSVNFGNASKGITVGEAGTTLYTYDGGITWSSRSLIQKQRTTFCQTQPKVLDVKQNYPNPFNPSTQITYVLPCDSKVSLKVYDMIGREVANLVNDFQTAGSHSVTFNANNLSSGIYFYKMTTGDYSVVKRMMLVK